MKGTLTPDMKPYGKDQVFVVMTAVPSQNGRFDGSERVESIYEVSESSEAAMRDALLGARMMNEKAQPCGFFSLLDVERLGEWLGWSEKRWLVVKVEAGAFEVERIEAKDRREALRKAGPGFAGLVSGGDFERLRAEMEEVCLTGGLGNSSFAFLNDADEEEWNAMMRAKRTEWDDEKMLRRLEG